MQKYQNLKAFCVGFKKGGIVVKEQRLKRLVKAMEEANVKQLLVTDPTSIFYLTGKWIHPGERMLALYINVDGNNKLFINELFPVEEDLGVEKVWFKDTDDPIKLLVPCLDKNATLGIDKNWPARFLLRLMEFKAVPEYVNGSNIVDRLRMIKDEEEIELLRRSSQINDQAIERLINELSPEFSEKDMKEKLLAIYKELGVEGLSFEPIISYGPNCADPHHDCDDSMLKEGDSIVVDIGCIKDSYCSDMTRTLFYKNVSEKHKEIYNIVLEANRKAIEIVKPGVRFCDVDLTARKIIEDAGYGKYFTHRTGHSIGIEDHETGDVSSTNTDILKPGMVFSVEPGIYLPGEMGVRIEDLVVVTEDGYENLNSYDKSLKIIE